MRRLSRLLRTKVVPVAVLITMPIGAPVVWAQPAAPAAETAPAAPEGGKPLAGKGGFSLDQLERANFDEKAKAIQAKMSELRQKKIDTLDKLLAQGPPSEKKADVLFRLAEAHWEESKYQYLLARDTYDKNMTCFEEKRCAEEPTEPVEDYSVALGYYRQVLAQFPAYNRIDEVMYYLGKAAMQAGRGRKDSQLTKEGVKHLQDLVQQHPKSRFIAESHLALGEYFFETDSLFYAKTNYEKIIQSFPNSPLYNYALYKLGWVYFNLTEYEKTIDTFKKVVAAVEKQNIVEFREQALNDLVVTYAELDNGWRMARDYFMKQVGEVDTYKKLDRMAGLLGSKDRDDEAIDLYKHLIDHDKVAAKVVEYFDAIMELRRKIGDMGEIETEINTLVAFLDDKGAWRNANKGNADVGQAANDLMATNLFFLANHYHQDAQKADDQKKPSGPQYERAAHYYAMFLDRFPEHKEAYKLSFYYAEILYDQIKDYEKAAAQYEKVISRDSKGEFVEDAALGAVYAIEGLMVKAGLRPEVKQGEIEYVEEKRDLKDEMAPIPKTPLHDLEQRYIAAADAYVKVMNTALQDEAFRKKYPDRGKMIPNIMFIAAQTFYMHGEFRDAVERLMVIFDLYPKHRMASVAVNVIIDCYARLKHWEKIEEWARKLIKERNFKVKTKEELEQMIAIAKTEHARDLTKQRMFDEAVRVQREIVDEFGRSNPKLASAALYNVGVIHESARRFPQAVEAYEEVIKRYPKEEVAVKAQFDIGVLYENQTQFAEAATAFIEMERFKENEQASDAIRNAGLIYAALEEYDKAHDTFERYVKLFPKKEDASVVAFQSAETISRKDDPKAQIEAAKTFEKVAKAFGKSDVQYKIRAIAAAGVAYKKADKVKNRRVATKLLEGALKDWNKLNEKEPGKAEDATKAYAAMAALELAEYAFDDFDAMKIEAVNKRGDFDMNLLGKTLKGKAEALQDTSVAFDKVLAFQDPGMAAAAAFRLGQLYYEFAEGLFNAPVPPGLTEDDIDEYRFQLEEIAAPIQEKALTAFTLALKQALDKNVYNKWSRLSAEYAAKVNPDEFPISSFRLKPDKTKDTVQSTNFIRVIRQGDTVVDFTK